GPDSGPPLVGAREEIPPPPPQHRQGHATSPTEARARTPPCLDTSRRPPTRVNRARTRGNGGGAIRYVVIPVKGGLWPGWPGPAGRDGESDGGGPSAGGAQGSRTGPSSYRPSLQAS